MNDTELTTQDVAKLTGWHERTVRKHAAALGGERRGARKFVFRADGVRAGVERLGIPSEMSAPKQS